MLVTLLWLIAIGFVIFFYIYTRTSYTLRDARAFVFETGELIPVSHIEPDHDKPIVTKDGRRFGYLEASIRYV